MLKESFDLATARYPTIEPAVVFVGDTNIKANYPPNKPSTPEGIINGESLLPGNGGVGAVEPAYSTLFALLLIQNGPEGSPLPGLIFLGPAGRIGEHRRASPHRL